MAVQAKTVAQTPPIKMVAMVSHHQSLVHLSPVQVVAVVVLMVQQQLVEMVVAVREA